MKITSANAHAPRNLERVIERIRADRERRRVFSGRVIIEWAPGR